MTTRRRTLAAAALCLLLVCSLLATGCSFSLPFGSADLTFKNSTGNTVHSVYVSPETSSTWGDPVNSDTLRNGGSLKIDWDDLTGYGPGTYDVAAVDEYGMNYDVYGVYLTTGAKMELSAASNGVATLTVTANGSSNVYYADCYYR